MTEGTKSVLLGCHNPLIHGLCVLRAWRQEYGSWPCWWQIIGIFLHDIGVWGREYLSDDTAKRGHWKLGADLTSKIVLFWCGKSITALFAWHFVAGHCPEESRVNPSPLMRADKRSWLVAPELWMWWNYWFEGFKGYTPKKWKRLVAENLKRKDPIGNHELYKQHRVA